MKKKNLFAMLLVTLFSAAVVMSCGKKAESTEEATEQTEAPADSAASEHPSEHPTEHPSDTTQN
ncbi:MAG: hypothetical protein ACO3FI_12010 [Cyclobacteriaceae bacterium]